MPHFPIATPIAILSSVATHDSFEREYVGKDIYTLEGKPGFFRQVKANAKRTLTPHNEGAVLAVAEEGGEMRLVEFVPFKELYELITTMALAEAEAKKNEPPAEQPTPPAEEASQETCPAEAKAGQSDDLGI